MTEFALVLPILALLLFGIIQFGIVFNNYVQLTDATRAGARKAAVSRHNPNPRGDCIAAVVQSVGPNMRTEVQSSATCESTWEPGADVTVSASYPYSISLLGLFSKSGRLTSTTTERVE